jgi:CelD/BcsL family acetyltransferase involved in cellulose biosynthesis
VTGPCTASVLTTDAEVEALLPAWWALVDGAADANVYLTPAWAWAWWRAFGRGPRRAAARSRLHVVAVHRDGDLVALAPLLEVRAVPGPLGVRMLVGLGAENADFGGVLVDRGAPEAMGVLVEHLGRELGRGRTVLNLTRLEDASPLLAALRSGLGEDRHRFVEEEREDYPYLDLAALEDPERDLRRLLKKNDVGRRGRRLAEVGEVGWVYHRPEHSGEDLEAFLRLHDLRWAGRAPTGPFTSAPGRAFLAEASAQLDRAGLLRISFVTLDGTPIVGRYGTVFGGAYQGMKSGWDPAYKAYGPGHLVVGRLLEQLLADGVARFDFMRGAGDHKAAWTNASRDVAYLTVARRRSLSELDHRQLWALLALRYRWRGTPRVGAGA